MWDTSLWDVDHEVPENPKTIQIPLSLVAHRTLLQITLHTSAVAHKEIKLEINLKASSWLASFHSAKRCYTGCQGRSASTCGCYELYQPAKQDVSTGIIQCECYRCKQLSAWDSRHIFQEAFLPGTVYLVKAHGSGEHRPKRGTYYCCFTNLTWCQTVCLHIFMLHT